MKERQREGRERSKEREREEGREREGGRERGRKGEREICIITCNCHYLSFLINLSTL